MNDPKTYVIDDVEIQYKEIGEGYDPLYWDHGITAKKGSELKQFSLPEILLTKGFDDIDEVNKWIVEQFND